MVLVKNTTKIVIYLTCVTTAPHCPLNSIYTNKN